jgi:phage host-nuclease inhibitor protein Gam
MATAKAKKMRIKQDASPFPVPQSREDVTEAIAEIGRRQRERDRIQAAMNDELAVIKQRYEEQAQPHNEAITALTRGVQLWCEAHREQLCPGKVKTVNMSSGEVRWRNRPPKVNVRGADAVIEALEFMGLKRLVRVKKEVNKDAILAEQDAVKGIKGITISKGEDFVIVPFETELEEVAV